MARKIKRTWYSKKLGKTITKEYTYEHKSRKGKTLVDKNGRINKKNVDKVKQDINSREDLDESEKRALTVNLDALVDQRKQDKRKLTTNGFYGTMSESNVGRMLSNAGYSVEEVSEMYNIDENALLDEDNWNGEKFTYKYKEKGSEEEKTRSFLLQFGYTLDIFKEI